MWINFDITQGTSIERMELYRQCVIIKCTYLNTEQPSSCSTSRIRARCKLRLSLLLVSLTGHAFCCHAQPSILLFISNGSDFTPHAFLVSGWFLTNVQVNNITTLHDTHGHIYITSALLFFSSPCTSSTLFGRPASSNSSHLTQVCNINSFSTWQPRYYTAAYLSIRVCGRCRGSVVFRGPILPVSWYHQPNSHQLNVL